MPIEKQKYHTTLANYFAAQLLFFDGDLQKKPHVRKCMEQPWQQTKAELWDEVTETLCNLNFIQAKACAKQTYDLVKDYHFALDGLPEYKPEKEKERKRQERMEKYTRDLIACAEGEITIEELEVPKSITPWTQEEVDTEIERIKTNPTRADKLKDFINFLGKEVDNLQVYANEFPHFATQQAWNNKDFGAQKGNSIQISTSISKNLFLKTGAFSQQKNIFPQAIMRLKGHTAKVNSIVITHDGKKAFSGSVDKSCIIWDLSTGKGIKAQSGHDEEIRAVSITPDGKKAISAQGNTCIFWDLFLVEILFKFEVSSLIYDVSITPDGSKAICSTWNGDCILMDLCKKKIIKILTAHDDLLDRPVGILSINFTPDGRQAVSITERNYCILWDLNTGIAIKKFDKQLKSIYRLSITPDGKKALSCSNNNTCILWDIITGEVIKTLKGHNNQVLAVSISSDGKRAISGSLDNICIVWDLDTGSPIKTLIGHNSWITSVAITPDGKTAISGSLDNTCILWDLEKCQTINNSFVHSNKLNIKSITTDGNKVISYDGSTQCCILWDFNSGAIINSIKVHHAPVVSVSFTLDEKSILIIHQHKNCWLREIDAGKIIKILKGHKYRINTVCINADGKTAITGSDDNTCKLWNLATGEVIKTLRGHLDHVNAITITPDGRRAISGSKDSSCIVWDLLTGDILKILNGHRGSVLSLTVTPDGKRAISGSSDNSCIVWNIDSGDIIKVLQHKSGAIVSLTVSLDGKRLVSRSVNNTLILWNLQDGSKEACYVSNSRLITSSFCLAGIIGAEYPDGIFILKTDNYYLSSVKNLVTAVRIWDTLTEKTLAVSTRCLLCNQTFNPSNSMLSTIELIIRKTELKFEQSPYLEMANEVWEHPDLLSTCPKCGAKLKFNPFIAGGEN